MSMVVLAKTLNRETRVESFDSREAALKELEDSFAQVIFELKERDGSDVKFEAHIDQAAGEAWVNDAYKDGCHYDWSIHEVSSGNPMAEPDNDQKMLDGLLAAVQNTRSFGQVREDSNYIMGLKLIQKEHGWKDAWGKPHAGGKYVRIIWSDSPERDDGYYDVFVDGSSTWGILTSVVEYLKERA